MKITRRGWICIAVILVILAIIGQQQEELDKKSKGTAQVKEEQPLPPLPDMTAENQAEKAKNRFCEIMQAGKSHFKKELLMSAKSLRAPERQSFYIIIADQKDVVAIMTTITVGKIIWDEYGAEIINELVLVWNIGQDKLTALKGEGLALFVNDKLFEGENFGDKILTLMFLNCVPYQKIANMPTDVQTWLKKHQKGEKR